ncbi:hypothetical protein F5Y17DRAFT_440923 [Xylariaceae sp. FL0594]|nr:hypothetical protein F5Y17DRAFT_440923 [Xylariaceae sp. FL0594]
MQTPSSSSRIQPMRSSRFMRRSTSTSSSSSSSSTSTHSGSSPTHTINAFRQPSIQDDMEEDGVLLSSVLEPRPIVYWGGLEERLGGGR